MSPHRKGPMSVWCICHDYYFVGDDARTAQFDFATQARRLRESSQAATCEGPY